MNSKGLFPALSPREGEVFQMHQDGKTVKQIAELLQISKRTAEDILYKARKKMRSLESKRRDIDTTLRNAELSPAKGNQEENDD